MTPLLKIHTFGTFAIELNGEPVTDLKTRTAEAVLIYLIAQRKPVARTTLASFFWDDRPQSQAGANLRTVLSRLRGVLGNYLVVTRESVFFNFEENYWVDAFLFEQKMTGYLAQPTDHIADIERCLALYQGDFLVGLWLSDSRGFEEWVAVLRERLHHMAVLGFAQVVQAAHDSGRYSHGLSLAERWLTLNTLDEQVHRQLMWLYMRSGQKHLALGQYEKCRHLLETELATPPSTQTKAAYTQIRDRAFPPVVKLPAYATPFFGRQKKISEIVAWIMDVENAGILTLLGMGGSGKSRLATEIGQIVARHHAGRFLDGIVFINLVSVTNNTDFANTLSATLDLKLSGESPPLTQLHHYLSQREMLLIFDNFEQLTDGEATINFLANLTTSDTKSRILVTSRQRLGLPREKLFAVDGLPVPAEMPASDTTYESRNLFVDRVNRILGSDEMVGGEMPAIWHICHKVAGIPIAIELAAGMTLHKTPTQIAQAIATNIDTLATTMRDVPPRHRSIRAVFNHSWQLLSTTEQIVLSKLTIFESGFAGKAANKITGTSLKLLRALEAKSLVYQIDNKRFDLHPLVRSFAKEKLENHQQLQQRHAHYYLDWLVKIEDEMKSAAQSTMLLEVLGTFENVRTAWQNALEHGSFSLINEAITCLHTFFSARGDSVRGEQFFNQAVTHIKQHYGTFAELDDDTALILGRLQSRVSWYAYLLGRFEVAQALMHECQQQFQRLNSPSDLAHSIHDEASLLRRRGEFQQAKTLLLKSLDLRRYHEEAHGIVSSLMSLGSAERAMGHYEEAKVALLEARAILKEDPNPMLQATAANDLGLLARATGDLETARAFYEEGLAGYTALNDTYRMGIGYNNLGSLAHAQGDFVSGRQYALRSLDYLQEAQVIRIQAYPLSVLGRIARDEGDFATAIGEFQKALQIADEVGSIPKVLDVIFEMATVFIETKQHELAVSLFAFLQQQTKLHDETRKEIDVYIGKIGSDVDFSHAKQLGATWSVADVVYRLGHMTI
jgi:DNA-binding SARP family transcriptional activator/predicted ATPase